MEKKRIPIHWISCLDSCLNLIPSLREQVSIDRGSLQKKSGLLRRSKTLFPQIDSIDRVTATERSFIDRIAGSGSLVLGLRDGSELEITRVKNPMDVANQITDAIQQYRSGALNEHHASVASNSLAQDLSVADQSCNTELSSSNSGRNTRQFNQAKDIDEFFRAAQAIPVPVLFRYEHDIIAESLLNNFLIWQYIDGCRTNTQSSPFAIYCYYRGLTQDGSYRLCCARMNEFQHEIASLQNDTQLRMPAAQLNWWETMLEGPVSKSTSIDIGHGRPSSVGHDGFGAGYPMVRDGVTYVQRCSEIEWNLQCIDMLLEIQSPTQLLTKQSIAIEALKIAYINAKVADSSAEAEHFIANLRKMTRERLDRIIAYIGRPPL